MRIRNRLKNDANSQWRYLKTVYVKKKYDCTVEELEKKLELSRVYLYVFSGMMMYFLGLVVKLAAVDGLINNLWNLFLLLSIFAVTGEQWNYNQIQLFIYLKRFEVDEEEK